MKRFVGLGLLWLVMGCAGCDQAATNKHQANSSPDSPPPDSPSSDSSSKVALRLGAVLGGDADDFDRASVPRAFDFPRDHGAHPRFRSEWWYLTCPLRDASGAEYGLQFTVFRQGLRPMEVPRRPQDTAESNNPAALWRTGQIYMAHAALTDVQRQEHTEATRLSRGHPELAGVSTAQDEAAFAVYLEDWRLQAPDGSLETLQLKLRHRDEGSDVAAQGRRGFDVQLALTPEKPVVLQGDAGLSSKGGREASYYYSMPRLRAHGELRSTPNGILLPVWGACWFDREWSTSVLAPGVEGWDWLALQFDDGTELMAFQLRSQQANPVRQAKQIDAVGQGVSVPSSQVEFIADRHWQDEVGVAWPVGWTVRIAGTNYLVRAAIDDQRMRSSIPYWEGLVWVFDESNQRIGQGYLEMTGYARPQD